MFQVSLREVLSTSCEWLRVLPVGVQTYERLVRVPDAIIAPMFANISYHVFASSSLLEINAPINWRSDNACQTSREKNTKAVQCGHVNFKVQGHNKCEMMRLRFMEIETIAAAVQLFCSTNCMSNGLRNLSAVRLKVDTSLGVYSVIWEHAIVSRPRNKMKRLSRCAKREIGINTRQDNTCC